MVRLTCILAARKFRTGMTFKMRPLNFRPCPTNYARPIMNRIRSKNPADRPMRHLLPQKNPVTSTTRFLEEGIIFRDCVRCITIHYSEYDCEEKNRAHEATKKLAEVNFNQLQYMNPDVQILVMRNLLPHPFVTFFLEGNERINIESGDRSHIELLRWIQKVVGKPRELIDLETKAVAANPANFGVGYARRYLCDIQGQVPKSGKYSDFTSDGRLCMVPRLRERGQNMHWRPEEEE